LLHRRSVVAQHVQPLAVGDDLDRKLLAPFLVELMGVACIVECKLHDVDVVLIDVKRQAMRLFLPRGASFPIEQRRRQQAGRQSLENPSTVLFVSPVNPRIEMRCSTSASTHRLHSRWPQGEAEAHLHGLASSRSRAGNNRQKSGLSAVGTAACLPWKYP